VDGDGFITVDELRAVMRDFKMDKKGMNVRELLAAVDSNGDGRVDYDEFLAMMTAQDKVAPSQGKEPASAASSISLLRSHSRVGYDDHSRR
jgi:hypothetical protein